MIATFTAYTAAVGEQAFQYCLELLGVNAAIKTQYLGTFANPLARTVGIGAGLIIVSCEIIGSAASGSDICNRKHISIAPIQTADAHHMSISTSPRSTAERSLKPSSNINFLASFAVRFWFATCCVGCSTGCCCACEAANLPVAV